MKLSNLRNVAYTSLLELSTTEGIFASGKQEVYGCIFGRDSAITCLKILRAIETHPNHPEFDSTKLLSIVRNALIKLTALQGKEVNEESGEEPGKFIHEYRKDKYERLINRPKPWYVYSDGILRNYDSIDSTPLALIAIYKYWQITKDDRFLLEVLPAVDAGLDWIKDFADKDRDFLVEYELPETREHGGLVVQSWTDSMQSLLQSDGSFPVYPIAPVEVQGYTWLALKLWGEFYLDNKLENETKIDGKKLINLAKLTKYSFNKYFMCDDGSYLFPAQALDGRKRQINTVTGNALLLLWATYSKNGRKESIIDDKYIPYLVERSFADDMFEKDAGIRTMSTKAATFNPNTDSYHNGSFWPKLNGMVHEGLTKWGYKEKADLLKAASIKPIEYFGTPIELYIKSMEGTYHPYKNQRGQESCKVQAWSAAVMLDLLKD